MLADPSTEERGLTLRDQEGSQMGIMSELCVGGRRGGV